MAFLQLNVGERSWEVHLERLLNVEVMAIERAVGMTVVEFGEALEKGSVTALTAIAWILRRREEPGLKFEDVQFELGDLGSKWVGDEDDPVAQGKGEASEVVTAST